MTISKELLDELLKGCEGPEDLLGMGRVRTSSSPLWTASRASLTPSRQPLRMLQSKPASFTRCVSGAFAAPLGPRSPSNSLNVCGWKDRKAVAADLRRIYGAQTAGLAAAGLDLRKNRPENMPRLPPPGGGLGKN